MKRAGVADHNRLQLGQVASFIFARGNHRQIAARVGRDDLGFKFLPAGGPHAQLAGPLDHVIHRQDLAVIADHDA